MNIEQLQACSNAWNEHDIDTVMAYVTDDCIFETGGGGTQRYGRRHVGFEHVRDKFVGPTKDGSKMELDGCDLFIFADGKIKLKNSIIKNRK